MKKNSQHWYVTSNWWRPDYSHMGRREHFFFCCGYFLSVIFASQSNESQNPVYLTLWCSDGSTKLLFKHMNNDDRPFGEERRSLKKKKNSFYVLHIHSDVCNDKKKMNGPLFMSVFVEKPHETESYLMHFRQGPFSQSSNTVLCGYFHILMMPLSYQ